MTLVPFDSIAVSIAATSDFSSVSVRRDTSFDTSFKYDLCWRGTNEWRRVRACVRARAGHVHVCSVHGRSVSVCLDSSSQNHDLAAVVTSRVATSSWPATLTPMFYEGSKCVHVCDSAFV